VVYLDEYDRKARLIPGLLVTFPVAIAIVALGLKAQPVIATAAGLLSALGGPFVVVSAVRTRGLVMQDRLFKAWGGAPTTLALRNAGQQWPPARRKDWRRSVEAASGVALPDATQEESDPQGSDGIYETAVARMRNMTRDKSKFRLVFQELRNFGYERNLLAVRPPGICVCLVSLVALVAVMLLQAAKHFHGLSEISLGVGVGVDAVVLAFWLVVPSNNRTWLVGRRYAEQLLDQAAVL
jgi:hypothetical protein